MKRLGIFMAAIFAASLAMSHPMGNFSVNRYARIEPSDSGVSVLYLVDFAEIPTFQELSKFPALAGDASADSLNRRAAKTDVARDLSAAWLPGLAVRVSSRPIRLRVEASSIVFAPGAGGLPTMKLTLRLAGSWPGENASSKRTLDYEDTNAPDRLGWREVVVRGGPGVELSGDFPTVDRSNELTNYPADPTADIPQVIRVSFGASLEGPVAGLDPLGRSLRAKAFATTPRRERSQGSSPAPPARLAPENLPAGAGRATAARDGGALLARGTQVVTQSARAERESGVRPEQKQGGEARSPSAQSRGSDKSSARRSDRFADLVTRQRLTPGIVLLSLLIAACLGGLHALSPGHGKTVVAAYLVGSRGTAKHALLLGLIVTLSHTVGVFLLGIVTLALSKAIVPEKLYPAIQFLSGLTIVAIGSALFLKRLRQADPEAHGHSHAVDLPDTVPTASALLALGVSGGILPCPSALVVLLSAIALHRVGFGLVLIVAFSAGLAAVLSGIGILVVRAGRLLGRFESAGAWARRLPAFSALLIGVLGLAIASRAFADVQKAFF